MSFQIVRNDITKVKADVIVNTANPYPVLASGEKGHFGGADKILDLKTAANPSSFLSYVS